MPRPRQQETGLTSEHVEFLVAASNAFFASRPVVSGETAYGKKGKRARSTVEETPEENPPTGKRSPVFPVGVDPSDGNPELAPPPLVDRYPTVIGKNLSFDYIASTSRLATTGYRQQAVDLWREVLEQDPHLASVLLKRILSVANGRLEVHAAVPEGHPEFVLASAARDLVQRELDGIPDRAGCFASLLWGIYYAISASEIMWARDSDGWHIRRLQFVHSRRLGYPDMQSWDCHVWDQGQVRGWGDFGGGSPTSRAPFGLRLADYPGKFILFAPQLFGDYPTRDGLARQAVMWCAFKRLAVRGAIDYLERFAKGFVDIIFSTQSDGTPRSATDGDIDFANKLSRTLGPGNGRTAVHPDSVTVKPQSFDAGGAGSKLTWSEWVQICNAEISKLVLGGTLGTEVGAGGGNRALGEVQERAEADLEEYDAKALAGALQRDIAYWVVRLNMPEAAHLVPRFEISVEIEPNAKAVAEAAKIFVEMGAPLEAEYATQKAGFRLVKNEETGEDGKLKARQLFLSDVIDPSLVNSTLKSAEAKKAEQDEKDSVAELARAKAAQPVVAAVPGQPPAGKPAAASGVKPKAPPARRSKRERNLADAAISFLLSSKRGDAGEARAVYESLLPDYPASKLDWVLAGHWAKATLIDLGEFDSSNREDWTASHDGKLDSYVEKLRGAIAGKGERKAIVAVRTPGNSKLVVVDGHHRYLAAEELGVPVLAYVADVHTNRGPWCWLHDAQKTGGDPSYGVSSYSETKKRTG